MILGQFDFPEDEWVFVKAPNYRELCAEHRKETQHHSSPWPYYEICIGCETIFFCEKALEDEKRDWKAPEKCALRIGQRIKYKPQFNHGYERKTKLWKDEWVATRKEERYFPFLAKAGDLGVIRELPRYDFWPVYGVEFDCQPDLAFSVNICHLG